MSKRGWLAMTDANQNVVVLNPDHIVSLSSPEGSNSGVKLAAVNGQEWVFPDYNLNEVAHHIGLFGLSPQQSQQQPAETEPSPVS
jgi:hypothetical protein